MTKELDVTASGPAGKDLMEILTSENKVNYDHLKAAQEELLARRKQKIFAERIANDIVTLNSYLALSNFSITRFKRIHQYWTYLDASAKTTDYTPIWDYLELFDRMAWSDIATDDINVLMKLVSVTLNGEALFDPITCQFYHKNDEAPSSLIPDDEPVTKPLLIRIFSFFKRK